MSSDIEDEIRQAWMCDAYIPKIGIRYRPNILLVAFTFLVLVAFYPDPGGFAECDELMTYLERKCPIPDRYECLHPYTEELNQCCKIETGCPVDEPYSKWSLVCKFTQCYRIVYNPVAYKRTAVMMFIVMFGWIFTFVHMPQEEKREIEEV